MLDNRSTIVETIEMWKTLCREDRSKKLKFEVFETAFTQTYALLSEHVAEDSLDKQYIQLIAEAYLFANINGTNLDSAYLAASVLTDRMLNSVAFSGSPNSAAAPTIYVLETREEIALDFQDINESMSNLIKAYDKALFKNLQN